MGNSDLSYHKKAIKVAIHKVNLILSIGTALAVITILAKFTITPQDGWRGINLLLSWAPTLFVAVTGAHLYTNQSLKAAVRDAISSSLAIEERKKLSRYVTETAGWFVHVLVPRKRTIPFICIKIRVFYWRSKHVWFASISTVLFWFASLPFNTVEHRLKMIALWMLVAYLIPIANWLLSGSRAVALSRLDPEEKRGFLIITTRKAKFYYAYRR